ncbi:hypothetical protein DOTSEDRAFT_67798 [Dothistroma septosporum NZE10]|uniref:DUF6314 domain-containing protein n=1 Tax=Dothistroma septosporum (strain NZE10 / CBS 128990) TaxID=675120 RepID=N1Q2H9_DOTSN|nr:hypothetical protein DOTSEDRAFT_67798 [Dothistroma septosporum NZE10]
MSKTVPMAKKTVAIVGAGPSGLAGARALLSTGGFDVTLYEKADRIGGIWALDEDSTDGFLHPNTPTNLSRFTVAFSDLDWKSIDLRSPKSNTATNGSIENSYTPMFPKAWQVNRYLEAYRQKYIPEGITHLGCEVISAERNGDDSGHNWTVTVKDASNSQHTSVFNYLLLGSGFFSKPRPMSPSHPDVPSKLGVTSIHSSEFRKLDYLFPPTRSAAGSKILIVGGGNSAGEAAAAVAQQLSNAQWSLDARSRKRYEGCKIVHVTPRPLYAIPPFTPVDETSTTFMPVDLKLYDLSKRPPGPITGNAGRLTRPVKDMIHGAVQGMVGGNQSDLTPALSVPDGEPRSAVYVALSESYPEFVRSGLIEVIGGRMSGIDTSSKDAATASVLGADGPVDIEDIGAIVYATGYTSASAIDFLGEDVKQALHYNADSLRLPLLLQEWQTAVGAIPELSLLGFYEGPFWGMIEMQARLTAERWLAESSPSVRPYEETDVLLELRKEMQVKGLDVPQYWFGDYAGYMEEVAAHLGLKRNDGAFAEREGCVSPSRYMSAASDHDQAASVMQDLHDTWHACVEGGKYTARAAFRALQGRWHIQRTIDSTLPTFPSGTLKGEAIFHPRTPTKDSSGKSFDFEYLYIENGVLKLANGAEMNARRRYVYRYSEECDELSVWFVKPDNELQVDYLFHNLTLVPPAEAKKRGACVANADHLCVEDMYRTRYSFPIKGIALHTFETTHTVKGPSKDYVTTTTFARTNARTDAR